MNKKSQSMHVSTFLKRVPVIDHVRVLDADMVTVFFGPVHNFDMDSKAARSTILFIKAAYQQRHFVLTIYTNLKGSD